MRLIDKDNLIFDVIIHTSGISRDEMVKIILAQPTIDPVQHGKWIDQECGGYECSECEMVTDHNTRYCPNCGTRMEIKE